MLKLLPKLVLGASLSLGVAWAATAPIVLGDKKPYTKGPYFAWMAPFNAGSLVSGKDYIDTMTVYPDTFPNATAITWKWPNTPSPGGVYGFLAVQYGDYYGTYPQTPIPSKRVRDITALTSRHDLTIGGTLSGFDVIFDFFLTSAPGGTTQHLFEIEVFLHTPPYSAQYVNGASLVGTYVTPDGMSWKVTRNGGIVLFMPSDQSAVLSGTIDMRAMLRWLMDRGTLTGNEYFNGLGLGSEPRQADGWLTVNAFSMTYQ